MSSSSPPSGPTPDTDAAAPVIARALVDGELDRIMHSETFRGSRQHQRLLRHVVEHTLAGNTAALKESVLAFEVFQRPIDFDPARDTIVRVEARRLRQRLERYYAGEGAATRLVIGLPVGSYVPTLKLREESPAAATLRARDLVERGYHFLRQGTEDGLLKALDRFDASQREAPDFALAYLGAARVWINLVGDTLRPPDPCIDHATEALQRALALDAGNAEAQTLLGSVLHRYAFDWPAAEPHFRRAIELAPQTAFVHMGYGAHLAMEGRFDPAQVELKAARELDPHYLSARWQMVMLRASQRRFDEARKEVDALLDLVPDHLPAQHAIGALALWTGQPREALAQYQRIEAQAPQLSIGLAGIGQALGLLGDREGVERVLQQLRDRFAGRYLSPYQLALIELRRGDAEAAMSQLEAAAMLRDPSAIFIGTDPSLDALRGHPRLAGLLQRHRRREPPAEVLSA
jgi:tetratricopeptide (TPR) repeat protein